MAPNGVSKARRENIFLAAERKAASLPQGTLARWGTQTDTPSVLRTDGGEAVGAPCATARRAYLVERKNNNGCVFWRDLTHATQRRPYQASLGSMRALHRCTCTRMAVFLSREKSVFPLHVFLHARCRIHATLTHVRTPLRAGVYGHHICDLPCRSRARCLNRLFSGCTILF